MIKSEYLGRNSVVDFLSYFSECLTRWRVCYKSEYKRILSKDQHFAATGVEEALRQYRWPATFTAPAELNGFSFHQGQKCCAYDWNSTLEALNYLGQGLRSAIHRREEHLTLQWCKEILIWGLGQRSLKPYKRLVGIGNREGVIAYLTKVRLLAKIDSADTDQIANEGPYMSSGFAKLHSLATEDGLVILDSRVAAALGTCINQHLRNVNQEVIPNELIVPRDARPSRTPTRIGPGPKGNHPIFKRDSSWLDAQVRVSWLLQAVLEENPQVFPDMSLSSRVHRLEAALFMMGANIKPQSHQFPKIAHR